MRRQLISGPNFSGRTGALHAGIGAGGSTFFIGPYAEAALSGLATTVADEIAIYRDDRASAQRTLFSPLDPEIYADRRPQTLSGGEQVLLALQCFSQSSFGAIAIDTALEQLDADHRVAALRLLSQADTFDVALIDNRLATPPAQWSCLTCKPAAPAFACDLDGLAAELAPHSAPRLAIRNLDFHYRRGADVFRDAELTLEPGHAYRLCGRNGAGKTTLIKILVGVLAPSRAEVSLDGRPYAPWRDGNAAFALATQNPDHQWCGATLREDILRRRAGLKTGLANTDHAMRGASDAWMAAAAGKLGIASLDQHLYELPLAARKRLSWLWPLSGLMPWVVLDEPTIGQDRDTCDALAGVLARFCSLGYGVVFVTHDGDFAGRVPHQVVTVDNRNIVTG